MIPQRCHRILGLQLRNTCRCLHDDLVQAIYIVPHPHENGESECPARDPHVKKAENSLCSVMYCNDDYA